MKTKIIVVLAVLLLLSQIGSAYVSKQTEEMNELSGTANWHDAEYRVMTDISVVKSNGNTEIKLVTCIHAPYECKYGYLSTNTNPFVVDKNFNSGYLKATLNQYQNWPVPNEGPIIGKIPITVSWTANGDLMTQAGTTITKIESGVILTKINNKFRFATVKAVVDGTDIGTTDQGDIAHIKTTTITVQR